MGNILRRNHRGEKDRPISPSRSAWTRSGSVAPTVFGCLALVILAGLIYAQAAGFGFLHFDDPGYVTANPMVRAGLAWDGVLAAFSLDTPHTYWHPATWLSLMLDVELFGVSARAMHLVNAGLHALAAVFFFLFLRVATGRLAESLTAAAVFAAHPLAVEAVAWVAERKTVLSGALAMASLLAYAGYARKPGPTRYLALSGLLALGLMAKPTLAALPVGLLALDFWPLRRVSAVGVRRLALEKLPLLALAAMASGLVVASRQDVSLDSGAIPHASLGLRLANLPVSCFRYLGEFLWPYDLSVFSPFPTTIPAWQWAGAGALLLALAAGAWVLRRRAPYLLAGLAWFLALLAPVSGLVQTGLWPAVADRFAYLPMAGLAMALSFGLYGLVPGRRVLASALAVCLVLGHFALLAWAQAGLWSSGAALFGQAARLAPQDPVVRHHLGVALVYAGRMEEGLCNFQAAQDLAPKYVRPRIMAGDAMLRLLEFPGAEKAFREALALEPGSRDAGLGLAEALAGQGRAEGALHEYRGLAERFPEDMQVRLGFGRILLGLGRAGQALAVLEGGGGLASATLLAERGRALLLLGRLEKAEGVFAQALRREPELVAALEGQAGVLDSLGRSPEAKELRQRARQVAVREASAFVHLGQSAVESGRIRDATGYFRRALHLVPGFAPAEDGLASTSSARGKTSGSGS